MGEKILIINPGVITLHNVTCPMPHASEFAALCIARPASWQQLPTMEPSVRKVRLRRRKFPYSGWVHTFLSLLLLAACTEPLNFDQSGMRGRERPASVSGGVAVKASEGERGVECDGIPVTGREREPLRQQSAH